MQIRSKVTSLAAVSVLSLAAQSSLASETSTPSVQTFGKQDQVLFNFGGGSEAGVPSLGFYGQTMMSNDDTGHVVGYRSQRNQFSVMAGEGDGSDFAAAEGFGKQQQYFHGGAFQDFSYKGANWQHSLSDKTTLDVGRIEIDSHGLEQRSVDYVGVGTQRFSLSYSGVERGGEAAAKSLGLSLNMGKAILEAQRFTTTTGGKLESISLSWSGNKRDQYGLSFSMRDNVLLEDDNSSRIVVSYQRQLGYTLNQDEASSSPKVNTAVLLGAGAVALALAGSSGSSDQDNSERFEAQHAAARGKLNEVNPLSVRENREYGGFIYQTPDGRYVATRAVTGDVDSVSIPFSLIPPGMRATASYHTHSANDPRYDNENFSFTDIASDQQFNLDGYLGTPLGAFKWHDVSENRIVTLGGPGSISN